MSFHFPAMIFDMKRKKLFLIIQRATLIGVTALPEQGGGGGGSPSYTHYASTTGTATYSEAVNINTPCSLSTAFSNAVAGNVVAIRGGTYAPDLSGTDYEHPYYRPTNDGTSGNPITFIAYEGETVIIQGDADYTDNAAMGTSFNSYITFDGLTFQIAQTPVGYNTAQVFRFDNSDHCIVRNSEFIGVANNNSATGGNNAMLWMVNASSCEVYNNTFRSNTGGGNTGAGTNTGCVWMFTVDNTTIRNNVMHSSANAIMQKNPSNTLCDIYDNYIYDINLFAFSLANQVSVTAIGHDIYNNLIRNAGAAFFLGNGDQPVQGYSIHHNTMYDCDDCLSSEAGTAGYLNLDWHSNIIHTTNIFGMHLYGTQAITRFDNNCYYRAAGFAWSRAYSEYYTIADWRTIIGDEENSITSNPTLVNAGGTNIADYALAGGSPCLGAGVGATNMGCNTTTVGIQ